MTIEPVRITEFMFAGPGEPLVVLAGPCVIESRDLCLTVAERMRTVCADLGLQYVFKASFDKANRTSIDSFRGPGLDEGLAILADVKAQVGVPVVTDVHEEYQVAPAGEVVDVLQIPAFLCRQTDLLVAAGRTGRTVNVKKGQFLAPEDMAPAIRKIRSTGNSNIMLTERGTSFGYHNLVVDMRSLVMMAELGVPVVFDCTHAVQIPGGKGTASGGRREFVRPLARAAAAVGIHGMFVETHPDPDNGLSDGPNMVPLGEMKSLLEEVKAIHELGS